MVDNVYRVVEAVRSSDAGIEDAIERAVDKASESLRHLPWFEVTNVRGHLEAGKIAHYQVTIKAGFTREEGRRLQP